VVRQQGYSSCVLQEWDAMGKGETLSEPWSTMWIHMKGCFGLRGQMTSWDGHPLFDFAMSGRGVDWNVLDESSGDSVE
jgi:hypothetical protein